MVTKLERIEYVEDPHLGKDSYCVVERHADGGACSVPDYAAIKLFRHIVQGEGPDTIVREIDEAIQALPEGYDTVCTDGIFSQGEWQLLSIARAAAADPAVLLLDEITEGLAPIIVDQLAVMVQNLLAEGVTILIAEQNVKFATKVSSDCYILERGAVVHHQATQELSEETRKQYLGL